MKRSIIWSSFSLFIIIFFLTGCSSKKIVSELSDSVYVVKKKDFLKKLSDLSNDSSIVSYYGKGISTSFDYQGSNYSVRSNLFFERNDKTIINVRLPFPPVSVGKACIDNSSIRVSSKILNIDLEKSLPIDFNSLLQEALVGRVPSVFKLYRSNDFSRFDIILTKNEKYRLSRSLFGLETVVYINASDFLFEKLELSYNGCYLLFNNRDYSTFNNSFVIPSDVFIDVTVDQKNYSLRLNISNVSINGNERLEY